MFAVYSAYFGASDLKIHQNCDINRKALKFTRKSVGYFYKIEFVNILIQNRTVSIKSQQICALCDKNEFPSTFTTFFQ